MFKCSDFSEISQNPGEKKSEKVKIHKKFMFSKTPREPQQGQLSLAIPAHAVRKGGVTDGVPPLGLGSQEPSVGAALKRTKAGT